MKLKSFFSLSLDTQLTEYNTVHIVSNVYYPLCISLLLDKVQKKLETSFIRLELHEHQNEVEQKLAISFLGQQQTYWIGSLDTLSSVQRAHWVKYFNNYVGIHKIWYHTKEETDLPSNHLCINLPQFVTEYEFQEIAIYLFPQLSKERFALLKVIFKERKNLSLDVACMLLQYATILSAQQIPEFVNVWVNMLLTPDHSLFTLSTVFFAKDLSKFLTLWQLLKPNYSVHFWISYWSDQLFRAYQYISARKNHDVLGTKKYAYRLPFSFIQRHWKEYKIEELSTAHQYLYNFDFQVKQGGDERFLDLLLIDFFVH